MTSIMGTKSKFTAGLLIAGALLLGASVVSAGAKDRRDDHRGGDRGHSRDWRGGGYYAPPPVVYGGPAYYAPPVVYGPGIGIALPGVSIGIN